jgi:hypothetical protein
MSYELRNEQNNATLLGRKHWNEQNNATLLDRKHWNEQNNATLLGRKHWNEQNNATLLSRKHWNEQNNATLPGRKHWNEQNNATLLMLRSILSVVETASRKGWECIIKPATTVIGRAQPEAIQQSGKNKCTK